MTPGGVDYGRLLRLTFVVTVAVGAPAIALAAVVVELPTWESRVRFAVGAAAAVWLVVAVGLYALARAGVSPRGGAGR